MATVRHEIIAGRIAGAYGRLYLYFYARNNPKPHPFHETAKARGSHHPQELAMHHQLMADRERQRSTMTAERTIVWQVILAVVQGVQGVLQQGGRCMDLGCVRNMRMQRSKK